jgi:GABA(A) receptor-associated protein
MLSFKNKVAFNERLDEYNRIHLKYPDRIPCIIEPLKKFNIIIKNKYLVPDDLTLGQLIYIIRRRIKLSPEKALFVFINNKLPPSSSTIKELYNIYREADGFLYFTFCLENTFG